MDIRYHRDWEWEVEVEIVLVGNSGNMECQIVYVIDISIKYSI